MTLKGQYKVISEGQHFFELHQAVYSRVHLKFHVNGRPTSSFPGKLEHLLIKMWPGEIEERRN